MTIFKKIKYRVKISNNKKNVDITIIYQHGTLLKILLYYK